MFEQNEWTLAEQLREQCLSSKEEDPKESAKLLHKIGLLYRQKSPDKHCLIQSVGLMTSAILRNPDNKRKMEKDLEEVCLHINNLAEARNKTFSIRQAVDDVKIQIENMRKGVEEKLHLHSSIPEDTDGLELSCLQQAKIDSITELQELITQRYIKIMEQINGYCIAIMGSAPCQYSLVGLGSLAKKEITPFSDFESMILLQEGVETRDDYDVILNYFRWFATVFMIILVRLGETVLRFLAIPCLNDPWNKEHDWFFDGYTPCGICPDGLSPTASKNPIGPPVDPDADPRETELIKTPSEMIKYLESTEETKLKTHLAAVLSRICFVAGDRTVYDDYSARVDDVCRRRVSDPSARKKLFLKTEEFNFGTKYKLRTSLTMDIKRLLFRGVTLYVSTLGRLFNVHRHSCLEIMADLKRMGLVTEEDYQRIAFSAAIACEVRLRFYFGRKGQDDFIWIGETGLEKSLAEVHERAREVGESSLIESLVTAIRLQNSFDHPIAQASLLSGSPFFTLAAAEVWRAAFVCQHLRLFQKAARLCSIQLQNTHKLSFQEYADVLVIYVDSLRQSGRVEQAINEMKRAIPRLQEKEVIDQRCEVYRMLGECYIFTGLPKKALKPFKKIQSLKHQGFYNLSEFDMDLYIFVAECYRDMGRLQKALKYCNKALKQAELGRAADLRVLTALHHKGDILMRMQRYQESLETLETCLELKVSSTPTVHIYDHWSYPVVQKIQKCWFGLDKYERALEHSRQTWRQVAFPDEWCKLVPKRQRLSLEAKCLFRLGRRGSFAVATAELADHGNRCFELKAHKEALLCWEEAQQLALQQEPLMTGLRATLAEGQGLAHFSCKNYNKAVEFLCGKTVQQVYDVLDDNNPDKYRHYYRLGCCFACMKQYQQAAKAFDCAWAIIENMATGFSQDIASVKQEIVTVLAVELKSEYSERHITEAYEATNQSVKALYHWRMAWSMAPRSNLDEINVKDNVELLVRLAAALSRLSRTIESISALLEGLSLAVHWYANPLQQGKVRRMLKRLAYGCCELKAESLVPVTHRCTPSLYYHGMKFLEAPSSRSDIQLHLF